MRSARRSSNGRATACPPTPAPGWFRPAASRPSTACAAGRASPPWTTRERQRIRAAEDPQAWMEDESVEDDRLRLIFTCCHPVLSPDAQVALTLREVCGLTTEAIAQAFLTPVATLAQRLVRAKARIREARVPYQVPAHEELAPRLDAVLRVIYLVFNEGYVATSGPELTRHDLSAEAIRLGRLLADLLPEPEALGLLALMLLHDSRRDARVSPEGEMVLLDDQDRSRWDQAQIAEGMRLAGRAFATGHVGPYAVQAAIAAVHARAPEPAATDWSEIVGLYDRLLEHDDSPVIALNRAVAVAMRDGPEAGLRLIDGILATGALRDYRLAHATRGNCAAASIASARHACRTNGRWPSPARSRPGASSRGGWRSCRTADGRWQMADGVMASRTVSSLARPAPASHLGFLRRPAGTRTSGRRAPGTAGGCRGWPGALGSDLRAGPPGM